MDQKQTKQSQKVEKFDVHHYQESWAYLKWGVIMVFALDDVSIIVTHQSFKKYFPRKKNLKQT